MITLEIDGEMKQIELRVKKIVKQVSNCNSLLKKTKDLLKKLEERKFDSDYFPIDLEDKEAAQALCRLHILRNHALLSSHYTMYSNLARTIISTRSGEV